MTAVRHPPLELFFSYAREDLTLREALDRHLAVLKRQGVISAWHDQQIAPGSEWAGEIDAHIRTADIILLLISADFLSSDYCYEIELKRAIERHEAGDARVIPVLLRAVDWTGAPFGKLQAVPSGAVPVTSWQNQDEAFADIAAGIRRAAAELTAHRSTAAAIPEPAAAPRPSSRPYFHHQQELIEEQARGVVGREYVAAAFDRFAASRPRGYFIIEGGPGLGKTSIAARLVRDRGWIHHFIGRTGRRGDPALILASLLTQLDPEADANGLPSRPVEELAALFEQAIRRRARAAAPIVMLFDALNELPAEIADDPAFLLTDALPLHTYVVVTSQSGGRLSRLFEQLGTTASQVYPLGPLLPEEIRRVVRARQPQATDGLIERVARASLGSPLYLRASLDALEDGRALAPDQFPAAVEGYFRRATRDASENHLLRDMLGLIAVCRKNLSLRELSEITGASQRAVHQDALQPIRPFLLELNDTYTFFHERFHDFVVRELLYEDELRTYHGRLVSWLSTPAGRVRDYYWTSLSHHLFESGDFPALSERINEQFLAEKLSRFGYGVLEDLEVLARSLLESGDPAFVERSVGRLDGLREIVGSGVVDEVARSVQPTQATARGRGAIVVPRFAEIPGVDTHAVLMPKRAVTADFIEVVPRDGRVVVTIGDAPATGLKSAFVARFIATLFKSLAFSPAVRDVGRLLSQVSQTISRHAYFERVSMQSLDLDLVAGTVSMASAGHPYPVLYSSRYQRCDRLPVRGPLLHARQLSLVDQRPYELRHAEIGAGDVIVLVSDGITEGGPVSDPYGYRFTQIVERHAAEGARAICDAVLADWRTYLAGSEASDDAAIIVMTIGDADAREPGS